MKKSKNLLCGLLCLVMVFAQISAPVSYAVQNTLGSPQENSTPEVNAEQSVTDIIYDDCETELKGSEIVYGDTQTDQDVNDIILVDRESDQIDVEEPPTDEEEYREWKNNLATQMQPQARAIRAMSVSNNRMYNEFLECAVAGNGRFTMGTTGGNPDNNKDDNKKMLYGHPSPRTSYTTIRIDQTNYLYQASSQPVFDSENNTCTSQYLIDDLKVEQVLSIVKNNSTQREDTVQVKYVVTNNGSSSHTLGLRIMFDTMLGSNDSAPFRVPGIGAVTKELELAGDDIPEYWQAFDSLTNPSVIAQGTILGSNDNQPDKVQFTNWGRVYSKDWGYTVNPSVSNGDSAVSII
jgi:hypothetical protein